MLSRNNNIADTLTSYYVNHPINRLHSPKYHHQQDKENSTQNRNTITSKDEPRKHKIHLEIAKKPLEVVSLNRQSSTAKNQYQSPRVYICKPSSVEERNFSSKHMLASTAIHSNHFMKQSQQNRLKTEKSRKKSVRFTDQATDPIQPVRAVSIKQDFSRKRSNSILKSRSNSREASSSLTKLKDMKFNGNSRSLNEYKNTVLKQKYQQILRTLKQAHQFCDRPRMKTYYSLSTFNQSISDNIPSKQLSITNKYTDGQFPPICSSIFKSKYVEAQKLRWKRISQIYPNTKLVVTNRQKSNSSTLICKQKDSYSSDYMVNVMNCIKQSTNLLQLIFQNIQYNDQGVYLIKIFQQSQWKYIMIDDHIPVREQITKQGVVYIPAFIKVKNIQEDNNRSLEIWPYLLEKAYASFMNCYEYIQQFDFMIFLVEMLGLPIQTFNFQKRKNQNWRESFRNMYKMDTQLMIGCEKPSKQNAGNAFVPLFRPKNEEINSLCVLQLQDPKNNFRRQRLTITQLNERFEQIKMVTLQNIKYLSAIQIGSTSNIGKRIRNKKYFSNMNDSLSNNRLQLQRDKMIIKTFTLFSKDSISLILKRKNNIENKLEGNKTWMRVILLMKELNSYRWIDGKYSNSAISMHAQLEPGTYYILVMPQSMIQIHNELIMIMYSRYSQPELKATVQVDQNILQNGCCDLAQRSGRLIQINKWICTYTFVDQQTGMIIQNINNERRNGNIRIFRSIKNLKPNNCFIIPYNKEFFLQNNRLKNDAQITIEKQQNYSVILMFQGGIDLSFLRSFNFGPSA